MGRPTPMIRRFEAMKEFYSAGSAPGSAPAPGSWLLAPGSWLLAPGSWLLDS